jgi:hypothetical protein
MFMTLVLDKGRPTPMDWIYKCRTYRMKIRYIRVRERVAGNGFMLGSSRVAGHGSSRVRVVLRTLRIRVRLKEVGGKPLHLQQAL